MAKQIADIDGVLFGTKQLKEKYFQLGESYLNLNCGSYGTVTKLVNALQQEYHLKQESHPDNWFRTLLFENMQKCRHFIADFIHAPLDNIVLVENASTAVNSILRSYAFKVYSSMYNSINVPYHACK